MSRLRNRIRELAKLGLERDDNNRGYVCSTDKDGDLKGNSSGKYEYVLGRVPVF